MWMKFPAQISHWQTKNHSHEAKITLKTELSYAAVSQNTFQILFK